MLDGIWQVYRPDGTYLGRFETRIGNDVLMVSDKVARMLSTGDILHIDETHTSRAWEVKVTGNFRGKQNEFNIERLGDRSEQYPVRKASVKVTSHLS